MKKTVTVLAAGLLFSLTGAIPTPPEQAAKLGSEMRLDSILATVNGIPVTLLDILIESAAQEARLQSLYSGRRLMEETAKLRRKHLEEIVMRKLVAEEYKKKPFEIHNQHIENLLDHLAATMGNGTRESLERRLRETGVSMDELRVKAKEKIAVDVLLTHHCDRSVQVTPRQVYEEYRRRADLLKEPARIRLQLLLVRKERKNNSDPDPARMRDQLKTMLVNADEETFGKIVQANTDGPNAGQNGQMGWVEVSLLRPEFAEALKNTPKGGIAGPVETPEGWYFLRVNDRKEEVLPSYETIAPGLEKELRNQAFQELRKKYLEDLSRNAIISYNF